MTIRRSSASHWNSQNSRKRRAERLKRRNKRRPFLETLEQRQLLAVGPQLAGIQPNDGALLRNGQVRNIAPQELVFHFNDGAAIDETTVDGIRLTRSGGDGTFATASATSDFNTNGGVVVDFRAIALGESGNGISISVIKNAAPNRPLVSVLGSGIQVQLNTTTGTTAGELVTAINNHAEARLLLVASIRSGLASTNISEPVINYSPIVTSGANAGSAITNLNVGSSLQMKLTANQAGAAGLGIDVTITRANFNGVAPPRISVQQNTDGAVIAIQVNSNSAAPTTAGELVSAINSHPQASALVTASLPFGSPDTVIGNRVTGVQLSLNGIEDIPIVPGFLGLGDSPRQVVMRFSEPLPDDIYHVELIGSGPSALRNVDGAAFGDTSDDDVDDGLGFGLTFELDLGAQILSVVPQPVVRNSVNVLGQFRDRIFVYFNDDDLHPQNVTTGEVTPNPTVVDPAFYQLIFTNDTVQNTDDVIYSPTAIQYDPNADLAVLVFDEPLDQLGSGAGTFRLRVGTNESAPLPPFTGAAGFGVASSDFNTQGTASVEFTATADFASRVSVSITKRDFGGVGTPTVTVTGQHITLELNTNANNETTAQQLIDAINGTAAAALMVVATGTGDLTTDIATPASASEDLILEGVGSSFDTASDLGDLTGQNQSLVLSAAIEPQPFGIDFPGDEDEPGHRDLRPEVQRHFLTNFSADDTDEIPTAFYNFLGEYGFDPLGNVLRNAITEAQKQRTREIFSLYSNYLGINFVETTEDRGMTIVTGDTRAIDAQVTPGPDEVLGLACTDPPIQDFLGRFTCFGEQNGLLDGIAIMDLQDFSAPGADAYGGLWFLTAMHEIGHLLGLGHTDELPLPTILNGQLSDPTQLATGHPLDFPENTVEPIFPGDHDVVHGQFLYSPDSKDIDLFKFRLQESGTLSVETFAERLQTTSQLDTLLSLYRQNSDGSRELIARNDDYFSNDSFFELALPAGTYWVGVTASGNDEFDPIIDDTGLGGRSQGNYDIRVNFRPDADRSIVDATGVQLDGDVDGVPGGVFNTWFRAQDAIRTIFVDKAASTAGDGRLAAPYQLISTALLAAQPGDVVRILANGGVDRNLATVDDNLAYEIGFNRLGTILADGSTLEVPRGVTVMVDSGAIIKLRRARIGVGSSSSVVDRSAGSLQILGTPVLLDPFGRVQRDELGEPTPGSVFLTSIHDEDIGSDTNPDSFPPLPAAGDWGGIVFQRDVDKQDANRFDYEDEGVFLNLVNNADIRYGGGNVVIDGIAQPITPVHITEARPTVSFNSITQSADAAMSASPNSFEETNFHSLPFQFTAHTADYARVGPDLFGNVATDNSINGLFVRVQTPAGNALQPLTVPGRFDDTDLPYILSSRLVVEGTPGGYELISNTNAPTVQLVTLTPVEGGSLADGTYNYRVVFVDADGNEGAPSSPTAAVTITSGSTTRSVELNNLPTAPAGFISRRIYRSDSAANSTGAYMLVAEINSSSTTFVDTGAALGRQLTATTQGTLLARLDARLSIDPGVIVKLNGGGIEATLGADFYAEGVDGREIVFTSIFDDRYGGGGTFDTTNDLSQSAPQPGNWGGVRAGQTGSFSLDSALLAFAGGVVDIEGSFAGFNAIELHQAEARIAHSVFDANGAGTGGQASFARAGRGFNRDATVFVRGSQPTLVSNDFINNEAPVISIDASSLSSASVQDPGRSTYSASAGRQIERQEVALDNQGPLIRLNRLDNNTLNGMQIRGGTLTTEGVWDDTDIVHIVRDESIVIPDFHTFGNLRLESSATESLVVKFDGFDAGITATGLPLDIDDRIGGALHMLGQAGHPVVFTSINDCTVGAGFSTSGVPQTDTTNQGQCGTGSRIFGPMIDHFADNAPNIDEWMFVADLSGRVSISVFDTHNSTIAIDGQNPTPTVAGGNTTISLAGLTPGSVHVFTHEFTPAFSSQVSYYRPNFAGVLEVFMLENQTAPNDGFNYGGTTGPAGFGGGTQIGSNLELGFDARFNTLPSAFADTTWFYRLDSGDNFSWTGLFDDFPGGADAAQIDLIDPVGNVVQTFATQPLLPGAGTTITQTIGAGQAGFWGVKLTAPPVVTPFAGHYLMDVEVTDSLGVIDVEKSERHYLLENSFINNQLSVGDAFPGDWRGVRLEQYSHDRNVEIIIEDEPAEAAAPGINATPNTAQVVGSLAQVEKTSDENIRLGFEVQASLTAPDDVDVFAFNARAGTEVWLDIDRTENSLDTVVELLDAAGNVLARSDNSPAETADPSLLFSSPQMSNGRVNPLAKSGYDPNNPALTSALAVPDRYTTNPRDAGMRVVLPGQPGAATTYHVRVRSGSDNLDQLDGGLTSGNYQLQIRLRELDEVPGSTIRLSDLRFATNTIEVIGQPLHSPLLGEAAEIESFDPFTFTVTQDNSTLAMAEDVGNLLQTDRSVLSVSGDMFDEDDVDFFRLEVIYDSVQPSPPNFHASTIFDIDYADGLARTDTALWIFDSDGKLILRSKGSNIADDRPRALQGDDVEDTSRGSVGTQDPFIGPVELQAGPRINPDSPEDPVLRGVYFVAVSSNSQMPDELRQYLEPNPPNPFVRLEPVNSLQRIAEDHINSFFFSSDIAEDPQIPVLLDPIDSVVPFTLSDVTLFVSRDGGLAPNTISTLEYIDPFTGAQEATAGSFPEPIGDIALRGDGNLFGFTLGPDNFRGANINDATVGTLVQIDTGTAATTKLSDDGVKTSVQLADDPLMPGRAEGAPQGNFRDDGVGVAWDAIAFQSDTNAQFNNGFVAGSKTDAFDNDTDQNAQNGNDFSENVLFHFDINNGVVANSSPGSQDRMSNAVLNGVGTQKREKGEILAFTRIVPQFPGLGDTFTITINSKSISYTAQGSPINVGNNIILTQATEAEVAAGLADAWKTAALTIPEFAAFEVLNGSLFSPIFNDTFGLPEELRVRLIDPAFASTNIEVSTTNGSGGSLGGFSSFFGESMVVEGFGPGGQVKGIDFINGQMYAVTDRGGLFEVNQNGGFGFTGSFFFSSNNIATYVSTSAIDLMTADNGQPIRFAGLTAGPDDIAGGRYADLLFGISEDGELYAFNTRGELQPIFVDNQTSVDTGLFGVTGLEFSSLDRNLWTVSTSRGANPGHGTFVGSDLETLGGSSFFFGNDRFTNVGGNQSFSNTAFIRDFNFAGGAHGSVISNPFDLSDYSPADLPVLYFNYFLETEDTDFGPLPDPDIPTRDALRVFVSDDNGEWTLLATNNTFQDAILGLPSIFGSIDEFDIGEGFDPNDFTQNFDTLCQHPGNAAEPCVQPLFDNTDDWRQARVPLDRYAGRDNVRLRFDFSTAGSMDLGNVFTTGSELRTIDGSELRDADSFTLDFTNQLEFDFGFTLAAPNGAALQDGDAFTVSPSPNSSLTFEFDDDGVFRHDIVVQAGRAYRDGQTFTVTLGGATATLEFDSGSSLLIPGAGAAVLQDGETFSINGVTFEFDDDGSFTGANNFVNLIVDQSLRLPANGGAGLPDGHRFSINDGAGGPDLVFEFDDDDLVALGARAVVTTNVEMQVPIAGASFGGIQDGDSFTINDGVGGIPTVFEFDKDNNVAPGSRIIAVSDTSSQAEVVNSIIGTLQASGLGLNPVNRGGGVIRLGVFRHTVDTTSAPRLESRLIDATTAEVADRLVDIILNSGLGLTPINAGNGAVRLGSTTHVITATSAPSISVQLVRGSQDEMANEIVAAIVNAGLSINPVNLGAGEVFLGATTSLDTTNTAALSQSGTSDVNTTNATPVVFAPTQTADQVAAAIAAAVNNTFGSNVFATGNVVQLPGSTSFSPDGTALAPAAVAAVAFDPNTSSSGIAANIEDALRQAFFPATTTVDLTAETNDRFATATDSGITGGAASFQAPGLIGDNLSFPFERALDVDIVSMNLLAGDSVTITGSTPFNSNLQSALRLFNSLGQEIASATGGFTFTPTTGFITTTPQIDFTAVAGGTYFVAVSGSDNLGYDPNFAGSADVTLQVPFQGGALGGLTDGELFTIIDRSTNTIVQFEFDRNGVVTPNAIPISLEDLVLQIPPQGVASGGLRDGDSFIINDNQGSGDVVFEFDTEAFDPFNLTGAFTLSPGAIGIFIDPTFDTAAQIASSVASAIAGANLGLSPSTTGSNTIQLFTDGHTVDISGAPTMDVLTVPRTQFEIVSLLTDAIRTAGVGLAPSIQTTTFFGQVFTFSTGGISLDVRDHIIDASLAPNLGKLIPTSTGLYDLSIDIIEPFEFHRNSDRINLPTATSVTQIGLPATFVEGRPGVANNRTRIPVNAGMTSSQIAAAAANGLGQSVADYIDQIVAVGGGQIADGEIFSISDGNVSVNFEFENGYSLQIPDLATDPSAYLDGESFTIARSGQPTTFEFDDNGIVGLGSIGIRFNDLVIEIPAGGISEDVNQNGVLDVDEDLNFNFSLDGAIFDGDTFTIDRGPGTPTIVFEYDTDGIAGFGNEVISVAPTSDEVEVANATVFALNNAGLGLNARVTGVGGGSGNFNTFSFSTSLLIQLGIQDHNVDLTLTPSLTSSTVLRTQDEIGELIVSTVASAGLGMNPTYLGNGQIHLGGNATHTLDLSNAVTLTSTGLPGVSDSSAIVIPVFPSDTVSASNVSQLILSAINTARVNQGLTVTAVADGARRVNLSGPTVITNFTQAPSLPVNRSGDTVDTYENIIDVIGHTVTNPGPFGLEEALAGDEFGAFDVSGPPNVTRFPGALRGMDNAFEGAYIDDLVIGFAERGEIVTGAQENAVFIPNAELLNIELPLEFIPHNEIQVGEYELEVRRAVEIGQTFQDPSPEIQLIRAFDTNDRLTNAVSFSVPAGHSIVEGQTFSVSDGLNSLIFEFDDLAIGNGVTPGNVRIPYSTTHSATEIARRVRNSINAPVAQAALDITAGLADGSTSDNQPSASNTINLFGNAIVNFSSDTSGSRVTVSAEPNDTTFDANDSGIGTGVFDFTVSGTIGDTANQANDIDLFSVTLSAGETIEVDIDASQVGSTLDPILSIFNSLGQLVALNNDFNGSDSFIQFTAFTSGVHYIGVSSFSNFPGFSTGFGGAFFGGFNPFVEGTGVGGNSTGFYTLNVTTGASNFEVTEFDEVGDSNVARDQGQIVLHSNTISNALTYGIFVGPGNVKHPTRTTREVNQAGLVPGIVIANNVIANNGITGIFFSGDATTSVFEQVAATPFGRIINNTVVGTGNSGTSGIAIVNNVSPTLLNNIVADAAIGIVVTNADAIIGGTVYRGNQLDVLGGNVLNASGSIDEGSFPIFLSDTDPLFIDEATSNFYLAPNSRAIDSSINSLEDRPELVAIRAPLGIGLSPILAPDLDALGQTRVDDPTAPSAPGQGSQVFKDRGALDRADFAGPTAVLITPRDNDALGQDSDNRTTFINLTNQIVTNFSIQLLDGVEPNDPQDGTGADDTAVRSDRVTLFRDDVKLAVGVDYSFSYDATNNIIRLTPLAGIWELDRKYDIELSNSRGLLITAPNGTDVTDGDTFDLTDDVGNIATLEFDSGYVLQVPKTLAIQIPASGGATIPDRDTIVVTNDDLGTTVTFEFDLDGFTTSDNVPVPFTVISSANDIANALVAAIQGTMIDVGLSPVNIENFDGRAVHLGTKSGIDVDVSNSSLQTTGNLVGIEDGQTFRVDDSAQSITFEFTSTGNITTGDQPIQISFDQTNEQIAETIVQTLQGANLGLNPRYVALSDGLINVGGEISHFIEADPTTTALLLTGEPGAAPEWSLRIPTLAGAPDLQKILDGEELTITNGTNSLTVELDTDGVTASDDPDSHPRIVVQFNEGTTADQLANAIAIAIRNGNVGLNPSNAGLGIIRLSGTAQHSVDLGNSSLVELGSPGEAAHVPVDFQTGFFFTVGVPARTPLFGQEEMAISIAAAITIADATGLLDDVTVTPRGEDINIEGVSNVSGLATFVRSDIVDIAGNPLKPNREDGTTRFTVAIGSGVDFGDAPAPYPTKLADNGARHEVVGDFFLGTGVDVDFDGQVSINADGDDNDGFDDENGVEIVQPFVGGFGGSVQVTASAAGFLDAWIDFNQDGDWNDVGEQIFNRQALVPGPNQLPVNVPGSAFSGSTVARYRFSSAGGLGPVGAAVDGEVEDYIITVSSNPWHNAANPLSVNGDQFVVPLDALIVVNFINQGVGFNTVTGALDPNPNPLPLNAMVDTTGDGNLTALDALAIINCLNNPTDPGFCPHLPQGGGVQAEGEGSTLASTLPVDELEQLTTPVLVDQRDNQSIIPTSTRRAAATSTTDQVEAIDAYYLAEPGTASDTSMEERLLNELAESDNVTDEALSLLDSDPFGEEEDFWT